MMSRDAGEPRPPRRARPAPGGDPRPRSNPRLPAPPDDPYFDGEEPSTFRPAQPLGEAGDASSTFQPAKKKTRAATSRGTKEPAPAVGGPGWFERLLFGRVSTAHLATFCRQFAAYLHAGVDILRSLDSLQSQFGRTALGPVIGRLATAIRRGDNLADAAARETGAFDPRFVSMIRVAEARGGVPETLRMLADLYESRLRLMRQARSAMIYPVIVLIVAGGVVALLTLFVLPALIRTLELNPASLPFPTRALIAFTHFVESVGWWAVPAGAVGGFFGLIWAYRTRPGRRIMDELSLYVPVLGKLLRKIDTTRLARTLSALLEAGVDIGVSLDLTADVVHLVPFRRAIRRAREAVVEGADLSGALAASHRFGPDVIAILNSGEETGKIPESLERLADDYEEQVEYMVKNLGSLIQPLLMVGLGGLVLFIILAVVLPYISMITSLAGG